METIIKILLYGGWGLLGLILLAGVIGSIACLWRTRNYTQASSTKNYSAFW